MKYEYHTMEGLMKNEKKFDEKIDLEQYIVY